MSLDQVLDILEEDKSLRFTRTRWPKGNHIYIDQDTDEFVLVRDSRIMKGWLPSQQDLVADDWKRHPSKKAKKKKKDYLSGKF